MRNSSDSYRRKRASCIAVTILIVFFAVVFFRVFMVGTAPKVFHEEMEMVFDDFGFTLLDQQWPTGFKDNSQNLVVPDGRFFVVKIRSTNHTDKVDFKIDPARFVVVSDEGERIRVSQDAQPFVDPNGAAVTNLVGGGSIERLFVFDVPKTASRLQLRVVFGGSIGEFADWLLLGNRYFEIEAPDPD